MSYKKEKRQFLYFFVDGKLYKMLRVVKARDEALAWCYEDHKVRMFQWSDVRKRASRGFRLGEAAKIVGRGPRMLEYYVEWGLIDPKRTYNIENNKPGMVIFSEEDVFKIRDIIANMHTGRPRKDGMITPQAVPSRQEVYAQIKHDMVLYTKNKDGEFIPLYAAEDW